MLSLVAAVSLLACGEEALSPRPDGGASVSGFDGGVHIAEPARPELPRIDRAAMVPVPPELPELTPCPGGWRTVLTSTAPDAILRCEPWPEGGQQACVMDEAHFPGEPGCVQLGTPCDPNEDWAV